MASAKDTRALIFSDGKSNKFWNIDLQGSSHTVSFGRVGTGGQTRTKDFDSEDEARKSFDRLVAAKLKKGYADAGGAAGSTGNASPATPKTTAASKESANRTRSQAATKPAAVETVATSTSQVDLDTTRRIDLDPRDWFLASYRGTAPLDRGTPAEFDVTEGLRRLAKLRTSYWNINWHTLQLPPALSREEAHFWLVAATKKRAYDTKMREVAEWIAELDFNGEIDVSGAVKLIHNSNPSIAEETCLALSNLFSPLEYVELVLALSSKKQKFSYQAPWFDLVKGFARTVLPYARDLDLQAIRNRLREDWDPHRAPGGPYDRLPPEYYLAALVGMHAEVAEVTSHWGDDHFYDSTSSGGAFYYQAPQEIVVGLGTAEAILAEWRRLRLYVRSAEDLRAFLACTEYAALDDVAETICDAGSREDCEKLLDVFTLVHAPEAAGPMLKCKLSARAPSLARDWLERHVGCAALGLIPVAEGRGKLADAAIDSLRSIKRKGHERLITSGLEDSGGATQNPRVQLEVVDHVEKVYELLSDESTPEWLARELDAAPSRKRKLPAWVAPAELPPFVVGERRLNDAQTTVVLQTIAATPLGESQPLLSALREKIPAEVRDDFAWSLFESWKGDGFPSKEKWAMGAIGHLGDDGCVLKLTPLVRAWPGESQHARAVLGLQCLRAVGSTTSLMQLSGIAQKLKYKALKAKAQQFVEEIARERGLTRDELEDRVIPDCGLDEKGRREFSFGSRNFTFVLGGDLKANVRDEKGKVRANLPKPGVKDDKAQAERATAEWKVLKKQIKEVAILQAGRLEQAMVTGRRWSLEDFQSLLVRHPLMTHLVQKLIWGGFDSKGRRSTTFRVTEERDYADVEDNATSLESVAAIGIVHPLELTEAERAAWGQVLSDYEIASPFPQLGRSVHKLESGEGTDEQLKRFHGLKLSAPTLVYTLEKLGWERGEAQDAGSFFEHTKRFPTVGVTAVAGYDGVVGMGYIDPEEILTIQTVHFCRGLADRGWSDWARDKKMKLEALPEIVISEVIADLQVIKTKAR